MSNVQYVNYDGTGHKPAKTGMSFWMVVFHGVMILATGGLWLLAIGGLAAWRVGANAGKPKTVVVAQPQPVQVLPPVPQPRFGQVVAHNATRGK